MNNDLTLFRNENEQELKNILDYWLKHTIDTKNGGFYGSIDQLNNVDEKAPKGAVLNGRILWTFSTAYVHYPNPEYLAAATRAFEFITKYLVDRKYGGTFWTVTAEGKPDDPRKQLYAIAFILYGIAEYFKASKSESAKHEAVAIYTSMLEHGHDKKYGGFWEGFTREWKEASDNRLSSKDANEKKSMNTSLHVVEALANLYTIWPDKGLKEKVRELLVIFNEKIIDPSTKHMRLFFDDDWSPKPDVISYGHDIEAAWLLLETAMIIKDEALIKTYKELAVSMADSVLESIDKDGGMWYEFDPVKKEFNKEKHWWPQAEAMVGFFNAYELSGKKSYLDYSMNSWKFIKEKLIDKKNGEWYGSVNNEGIPPANPEKVGLWKCPYHNSRACLEIVKRIDSEKS